MKRVERLRLSRICAFVDDMCIYLKSAQGALRHCQCPVIANVLCLLRSYGASNVTMACALQCAK